MTLIAGIPAGDHNSDDNPYWIVPESFVRIVIPEENPAHPTGLGVTLVRYSNGAYSPVYERQDSTVRTGSNDSVADFLNEYTSKDDTRASDVGDGSEAGAQDAPHSVYRSNATSLRSLAILHKVRNLGGGKYVFTRTEYLDTKLVMSEGQRATVETGRGLVLKDGIFARDCQIGGDDWEGIETHGDAYIEGTVIKGASRAIAVEDGELAIADSYIIASDGIYVADGATLNGWNVVVNSASTGLEIYGTAIISHFTIFGAETGLYARGGGTLAESEVSSCTVGVDVGGTFNVAYNNISHTGTAVVLSQGGTATHNLLHDSQVFIAGARENAVRNIMTYDDIGGPWGANPLAMPYPTISNPYTRGEIRGEGNYEYGTRAGTYMPEILYIEVTPAWYDITWTGSHTFTYRARYRDRDGQAPAIHRVIIDGSITLNLSYQSGSYSSGAWFSGTYTHTVPATHTAVFEFSDSNPSDLVRRPSSGYYRYPIVLGAPHWIYPTNGAWLNDEHPTLVANLDGWFDGVPPDPPLDPFDPTHAIDGYYFVIQYSSSPGNNNSHLYRWSESSQPNYRYPFWTGPFPTPFPNYYTDVAKYDAPWRTHYREIHAHYDPTPPNVLPLVQTTGIDGALNSGAAQRLTVSFSRAQDNKNGLYESGMYGYNLDILKAENLLGNNDFEEDKDSDGTPDGWKEGPLNSNLSNVTLVWGEGYPGPSGNTNAVRVTSSSQHYALNYSIQRELLEGKAVTVSLEAKGSGGAQFSVWIVPIRYDGSLLDDASHRIVLIDHQSVTSTYSQRYFGSAEVPVLNESDVGWYNLYLRWDAGTVYFDNVSLVYGLWRGTSAPPFRATRWYRANELNTSSLTMDKTYKYVYYDQNYGQNWVVQPMGLVNYLTSKGFTQVVADHTRAPYNSGGYSELDDVINARLSQNNCQNSVIVIASGNVPDTVMDMRTDPGIQANPSSFGGWPYMNKYPPIIQYLHRGGTIIWVGDVPFYYCKTGSGTITYGVDGQRWLLGNYIMDQWTYWRWWAEGSSPVASITRAGHSWGITVPDPVSRGVPEWEVTNALSEVSYNGGKMAGSWHKNFNSSYPFSGFIRYRAATYRGDNPSMNRDVYRLATFMNINGQGSAGSYTVTFNDNPMDTDERRLFDSTYYASTVVAADKAGNITGGCSWDFDTPPTTTSVDGWTAAKDIDLASASWNDGVVSLPVDSPLEWATPVFVSPDNLNINAQPGHKLLVTEGVNLLSTRTCKAQLYFITTTDPTWSDDKTLEAHIITQPIGQMNLYTFDVGSHPKWTGTIRRLALLPLGASAKDGETIHLDMIKLAWGAADRTPPNVVVDVSPPSPTEGTTVTFDAIPDTGPATSDLGSDIASIEWDFDINYDSDNADGDNNPLTGADDDVDATGEEVSHTYWEGGNNAGLPLKTYTYKCTVTDTAGNSNEATFFLDVFNVPPTITSLPVTTAVEDVPYIYIVSMQDTANLNPEGTINDPLTLVGDVMPSGMTITRIDDQTAMIRWVPDDADVLQTINSGGVHVVIHPEDDDGGVGTPQDFYIAVENTNDPPGPFHLEKQPAPPSLSVPPSGSQGDVGTLQPIFSWEPSVDPDPTGDTVTYKLQIISSGPNRLSYTLPDGVHDWDSYSSLVEINSITGTEYKLTFNLEDDTWYYWRVIAMDNHGAERVSSSWDDRLCYHEFHTSFSYDLAVGNVYPTEMLVDQNFDHFTVVITNIGYSSFDHATNTAQVSIDIDNGAYTDTKQITSDIPVNGVARITFNHPAYTSPGKHRIVVTINDLSGEDLNTENNQLEKVFFVVEPQTTLDSIDVTPLMVVLFALLVTILRFRAYGRKR